MLIREALFDPTPMSSILFPSWLFKSKHISKCYFSLLDELWNQFTSRLVSIKTFWIEIISIFAVCKFPLWLKFPEGNLIMFVLRFQKESNYFLKPATYLGHAWNRIFLQQQPQVTKTTTTECLLSHWSELGHFRNPGTIAVLMYLSSFKEPISRGYSFFWNINLPIHKILQKRHEDDIKRISSGSNNHNFFGAFYRHGIKIRKSSPNCFKFLSMSAILAIRIVLNIKTGPLFLEFT